MNLTTCSGVLSEITKHHYALLHVGLETPSTYLLSVQLLYPRIVTLTEQPKNLKVLKGNRPNFLFEMTARRKDGTSNGADAKSAKKEVDLGYRESNPELLRSFHLLEMRVNDVNHYTIPDDGWLIAESSEASLPYK